LAIFILKSKERKKSTGGGKGALYNSSRRKSLSETLEKRPGKKKNDFGLDGSSRAQQKREKRGDQGALVIPAQADKTSRRGGNAVKRGKTTPGKK